MIEEEWERYQDHFSPEKQNDDRHAFFMGCLRMLQISQKASRADLTRIAGELDRYLARDDACLCDECRQKRARGEQYSLVDDLFPEPRQ